jgi:hypothetical protein
MTESASRLRIIEETPAYWKVLVDNPPLNIVGASIFAGRWSPGSRSCRRKDRWGDQGNR